ncbi:transglutaminase domain-containing protein [Paenibacillus contaminans]|uniref:Transglutaminase domain-containing protein n=1 Tax=Paenibacillus contaminans TaxID=450362 RepID=A0A329ML07_9BACL|nr:transglutaminase domain-containing protein [Paenibacillus contaminans]RAV20320.1 transglutaminase domain-containing protein [Paenibacillus contaminans]
MNEALQLLSSLNLLTVLLVAIIAISVVQGAARGTTGSAKHLFLLLQEGAVTILSLVLAWKLAVALSPAFGDWLTSRNIVIPNEKISWLRQMYYTIVTALRDFSLMRSGVLLLVGYAVLKTVLHAVIDTILYRAGKYADPSPRPEGRITWTSSVFGGAIGAITGAGRALMAVAVLFMYTALFPHATFTGYIQQSSLYQKGAKEVIEPFTGDLITKQLPVFTKAVEHEFQNILQRKYEVIDARIPDDIALAAKEVTAKSKSDEEKAKALYQWIGTRVQYDWDKVNLYEQKRVWKEQSPEDTFATRKGVCIDYSRLYAVMARSVGLDVKVVTGLGYDGKGGYGPHAWNEVYVADRAEWLPLDSTWVSSGGNWFNPPNFDATHIRDA